jgi:3-deoxy-D-manno-octulosonic-acid transferase
LILNPAENVSVEHCMAQALADDFRVRNWGANEYPEDMTQVLLAGGLDDLGLFYRLAPVSFLGSSLVTGHGGRNPFEAAALGSAILYGPNVRQYLPSYTRLANAGAARIVNDAISLGTAVTRLVAPDQAAVMAHAGWDVVSSGADQTDRVVLVVQNILDKAERTN